MLTDWGREVEVLSEMSKAELADYILELGGDRPSLSRLIKGNMIATISRMTKGSYDADGMLKSDNHFEKE